MKHRIAGAGAPIEIVWDRIGIPHVFAASVLDAYRGMGYACASERLWQIHLSCLYANGNAAAELGPRFVAQDALHRTFDVPSARVGRPASEGDEVVAAYLDGLNAWVDGLTELPPEFLHAGSEPRRFTLDDIASRYRFTGWFQHRSWVEKMYAGRLIARHGIDWWRAHLPALTEGDEAMCELLAEPNAALPVAAARLLYPELAPSASNNWAVTSAHSTTGGPLLATDPHQPHSIPNTFFYVHLHSPGWDAFGAAFPGVPYFMMGYTRDVAWGLTTGMVDSYDVWVEEVADGAYRGADEWRGLEQRTERIEVRGEEARDCPVTSSEHGPLLETLMDWLGWSEPRTDRWRTAIDWSMTGTPSSAGVLARLPLAKDAAEFGDYLFEDDVSPLVNNIICVDRQDGLRRFIAATLPRREGFSGVVPLAGWQGIRFERSRAADLLVERDPERGFAVTANNDTLGNDAPFPIHTFPVHPARANRITEVLESKERFSTADFKALQLDLLDLHALELVPQLTELMTGGGQDVALARSLLESWDCRATLDAAAACIYYPLLARGWHVEFMQRVLGDETLADMPVAAPALRRWQPRDFLQPGSRWQAHRDVLEDVISGMTRILVRELRELMGDPQNWRWGELHQIQFWHALARRNEAFAHMQVGPDPTTGSPHTIGMAVHKGKGPGQPDLPGAPPCRVYHGPAFRLVVDLAAPERAEFVIAGGNGGRTDSAFATDHYPTWLRGGYFTLRLAREEIDPHEVWEVGPA